MPSNYSLYSVTTTVPIAVSSGGTGVSSSSGTGSLVLSVSPTLVTPVLGVATGTSITLSGKIICKTLLANGGADTWAGAGTYINWNANNAGETVFRNSRGTGVGGWLWEGLDASGNVEGTAMSLGQNGLMTLPYMTASTSLALNASKQVVGVINTGTGSNVLATSPSLVSPTLVSPNIGAASGSSLGLSGSFNADTVFLNKQIVTSEGTYLDWDTPSGNKTVFRNNRGAVATGGWTWEGFSNTSEGVAMSLSHQGVLKLDKATPSTSLALDSSRNVVGVANTGSGNNVLQTSPTLVTPVLGVATGTSLVISNTLSAGAATLQSVYGRDGQLNLFTDAGSAVNIAGAGTQGVNQSLICVVQRAGGGPNLFTVRGAGFGSGTDEIVLNCSTIAASTFTMTTLTASTLLGLNASKQVVSVSSTGTGSIVLATSPVLVTPNIGDAAGNTLSLNTAIFVNAVNCNSVSADNTLFLNKRTVGSEGAYVDWDTDGTKRTMFRNNRGTVGAVGGWVWESFINTSEGVSMSLSSLGTLDYKKTVNGNFTPSFFYWSPSASPQKREFGVTNGGSTRSGNITGLARRVGDLVYCYVEMNLSIFDNAPAILSTGWIGNFPKFGGTITGMSMATVDPGRQVWPGITNPNHLVTSLFDTQNSISSPNGDSVCLYADTTVAKVTTFAVAAQTYLITLGVTYFIV